MKKTDVVRDARFLDGLYRSAWTLHKEDEHAKAIVILDDALTDVPPTPGKGVKQAYAEAASKCFLTRGCARGAQSDRGGLDDLRASMAWARAAKITEEWAWLNLVDLLAYTFHDYQGSIDAADEMLALAKVEDRASLEYYGKKATAFSKLVLGDAAAEALYKKLLAGADAEQRKEILAELKKLPASARAIAKRLSAK
jgi:hypothetical protein